MTAKFYCVYPISESQGTSSKKKITMKGELSLLLFFSYSSLQWVEVRILLGNHAHLLHISLPPIPGIAMGGGMLCSLCGGESRTCQHQSLQRGVNLLFCSKQLMETRLFFLWMATWTTWPLCWLGPPSATESKISELYFRYLTCYLPCMHVSAHTWLFQTVTLLKKK